MLALARAGSTDEAARALSRVRARRRSRPRTWRRCGRGSSRTSRSAARARSAARPRRARPTLYAAIHARTGGWYPAVNAATLSLVAGDPDRAREFARAALDALARHGDGSYYAAATEAEAELVLGRPDAARDAIARAVARNEGDYGALTTTRRQLRLVCQATGTDPAVLAPLAGPAVVHFCGHRIGRTGRARRAFRPRPSRSSPPPIAAELERAPVGYAYGALAAGADILWAEALLEHGAELHVVLPLALEEFVRASVAPAGAGLGRALPQVPRRGDDRRVRDRRRAAAATTCCSATAPSSRWDSHCFARASSTPRSGSSACGTAAGRTARPGRRSTSPPGGEAGGRRWRSTPPGGGGRWRGTMPAPHRRNRPRTRVVRAAAVRRHARFLEARRRAVPALRRDGHRGVRSRARPGGGRGQREHVGRRPARRARRRRRRGELCARLQEAMSSVDLRAAGLPEHLALRLGAHLGPVLPSFDPVRARPDLHRLAREPHGAHRARHAAGSHLRDERVRRRAAPRRPRGARLRLRRPHARRQGLGPAADVQAAAPERARSPSGGIPARSAGRKTARHPLARDAQELAGTPATRAGVPHAHQARGRRPRRGGVRRG